MWWSIPCAEAEPRLTCVTIWIEKGLVSIWDQRADITAADARQLPMPDASADFVFVDPPYSTHIRYTEQPECIGTLDAAGDDGGEAYYDSMTQVISEIDRILRNRRYMALYVSDSWRKAQGAKGGGNGTFMPIGFELFAIMTRFFKPVDIIAVARGNRKLGRGNWHKSAEEGNYFLRGFNYLFIMKKQIDDAQPLRKVTSVRENIPTLDALCGQHVEAGVGKVIACTDVVSIQAPRGGSAPQANTTLGLNPTIGPLGLSCAHGLGVAVVEQRCRIRFPAVVEVVGLAPAIGSAGVTRVAFGPPGLEPVVLQHVCFQRGVFGLTQ